MIDGVTPEVFDDGLQTRDYVYVKDVAEANVLALTCDGSFVAGRPVNVGTGQECSVLEVQRLIAEELTCPADVTFGPPRIGDARRSCADVSLLSASLGFVPTCTLRNGLRLLIESVRDAAS
jgi:UDP-glucose 4-epimerase